MRRIFLGVFILGLGTLFALPFRKPSEESASDLAPNSAGTPARTRSAMDLDEIDLLVREVTDGVEIPVLFQADTDHSAKVAPKRINTFPLKYEDIAVPVDQDPFYANRFNATAAAQQARQPSGLPFAAVPSRASSVEERRMRFVKKRPQTSPNRPSTTPPLRPPVRLGTGTPFTVAGNSTGQTTPVQPAPTQSALTQSASAQLASSAAEAEATRDLSALPGTALKRSAESTESSSSRRSGDRSVLSPLPVLDATDAGRSPQWIRQPD